MNILALLATSLSVSSLALARPAEQHNNVLRNGVFERAATMSCIGLNDRQCTNASMTPTSCCVPLTCGSDSRCH